MLRPSFFVFGISFFISFSPLSATDVSELNKTLSKTPQEKEEKEPAREDAHKKAPKQNLDIQLNEPSFRNGVLSTTKGGTIKGDDLFLQAKNINYIRRSENETSIHKIEAEGDLLFVFKDKTYTGKRIELDVDTRRSRIFEGCSSVEPWFVGGNMIELESDGSGMIHNGFMTTSENERSEWSVESSEVQLSKGSKVKAKNVSFLFIKLPIFWLPNFSVDLKQQQRIPFKYRFRWDRLGPRLGISYDIMKYKRFKTELMFDILRSGMGLGLATNYRNKEKNQIFKTYNYLAQNYKYIFGSSKIHSPRYRFQGKYDNRFDNGSTKFSLTYDKISDLDMRGDFPSVGFDSGRIMPTAANLKKQTDSWISSINAKVRINRFQSVKQELPLFEFTPKPLKLGASNILLDSKFSAGYLDYVYAPHVHGATNFHSSRVELSQMLSRNFLLSGISVTPWAGYTLINYGNSPQSDDKFLGVAKLGIESYSRFTHKLPNGNYALEPYVNYSYFSAPSVPPEHHYIFDLKDGWHRLNMFRFGLRNFLGVTRPDNFYERLSLDLYARAFVNTPAISNSIPRVYADATWRASPSVSYGLGSAWDTKRNDIDHVNVKGDFTISDGVALGLEYRKRNAYAWRKTDQENFILDSFRSEQSLRHSPLSDRRDSAIVKMFVRFAPEFAVELKTRFGWGRKIEPKYQAYEIDVLTLIRGALALKLSLQYRTGDRSAMYKGWRSSWDFWLGLEKPSMRKEVKRIGECNYDN